MKLEVNRETGLVAVEATSDTSFHRKGDVWGETPARAADLIDRGLVVAAAVPKEIKTDEIDVGGGDAASAAEPVNTPKPKKGGRAPKAPAVTKADDAGPTGGEGSGGEGGGDAGQSE